LQNELERRASLQLAGGDHGPEAFVGPAAGGAAGALGDEAVDDDEADRLLGDVVGRVLSLKLIYEPPAPSGRVRPPVS
jgi:hypothetical protein